MTQTIELLSVLYELSLTNLKHFKPEETAKNFVKKFISKRSLQAGSVWTIDGSDDEKIKLSKIYAIPDSNLKSEISLSRFREVFGEEEFIITDESLIENRSMQGHFASSEKARNMWSSKDCPHVGRHVLPVR